MKLIICFVTTPLFKDAEKIDDDAWKIVFPFPVLLDINSYKNSVDITTTRDEIVINKKWEPFCRNLFIAICDGAKKEESVDKEIDSMV